MVSRVVPAVPVVVMIHQIPEHVEVVLDRIEDG